MNLQKEVPYISSHEDLSQYVGGLYVIEKYLDSYDKYNDFKIRIRNITRGAIRSSDLLDHPIHFKFYTDDEKEYKIPLRMFFINICLWHPFCELGAEHILDESYIITAEDIPNINQIVYDKIAVVLDDYNIRSKNQYVDNVLYDLRMISLDFSQIMGLHYDEYTFQEMWRDPEYRELIAPNFDENKQPVEIEQQLAEIERKLVSKLKKDKRNPFGVMLRAGTGLKTKQLIEFLVAIAFRPSLDGDVIPYMIKNSLLIGGLDRPSYMYLDALAARKPLIANNKEMGPISYFGKTANIAARTLGVTRKRDDCGTHFYIHYNIKSKAHLKRMYGKYYYNEEKQDVEIVDINDTSLIGKTIAVRSPITCCLSENHVCPTCVGRIITSNWDIVEGFAIFITEEYMKEVEQNILSTKHLMTTRSEKVEFTDLFYEYFNLDGEEIKLLESATSIKDLAIYINPEDINKVEEFDADSTYNNYIESGNFYIVNLKTGEKNMVSIKNDKEIYINTDTTALLNANDGMIPFKKIDEDAPIFEISIVNNSLVKPFYDLKKLLNTESKEELTADEYAQKFLDILVEAGIDLPISAGEMLMNRLCRRPDNVRRRPNFKKRKMPPYHFYRLPKVIEENGSVTIGLIFEQYMRQFMRLDMDERTDTSFIDSFFKKEVSMEPYMRQRRLLEKYEEEE